VSCGGVFAVAKGGLGIKKNERARFAMEPYGSLRRANALSTLLRTDTGNSPINKANEK
jgi:hypothetical protein